MTMGMSARFGSGAGDGMLPNGTGQGKWPRPVNEQMFEYYCKMREEGRRGESEEQYASRIYAKLQMGEELTVDEMRFLARTNPVLYQKALRVQAMRKMLENRLKNCKSKQEAQEVFSGAASGVSDKDPDKEMLVAALKDVYMKFIKSEAYQKLPEKEEGAEESGRGGVGFDVDESGYQIAFAKESAGMAFAAKG